MNRADLLPRALQSIAGQTIRPAEIIVVDDGSTDATAEVARSWGATVISTPTNMGSGPARNLGIEAASTRWIAFLDSDDEWSSNHLETLMAASDGHVLVTSAGYSSEGRFMGNPGPAALPLTSKGVLQSSETVSTSSTIARRDVLQRAGLFRPLRRAQDLDMWIRVLEHGSGVALPAPTLTYHIHGSQAIRDQELMRQCFAQIVESCAARPWFDEPKDTDRAFVRMRWDDLRAHQRDGSWRSAATQARWLAQRPHTWGVLADTLRLRRRRRQVMSQ